ncbi:MAG: flagellar basal body P-ring formation protein FlgA [bacterium]|nr:flagellar basal body P-ring formation protein FlgA [bacterium]
MTHAQQYPDLENAIAATWQPHNVRVVWEPTFGDPALLAQWKNVNVESGLSECAHDVLTLSLRGLAQDGTPQRLTLKGRAYVFGDCWTVVERIKLGAVVTRENLVPHSCDWSNLRTTALLDPDAIAGKLAVRPLVPGRAILATDVRPKAVIRSGDPVTIVYEKDGVRVSLDGVAMKDGGIGERIPVRVPEVESNRLEGVIEDDATLRWVP